MKFLVIFLSLVIFLLANERQDIFSLYQLKEYDKACQLGLLNLNKNRNDENFVSIYAFSCLNADYIDRLSVPITLLKNTPESRSNAAYLSVILMQKKLLEHSLNDEYYLKPLKIPTTDNLLSKVFDLYSNLSILKKIPIYEFIDTNNAKIRYRLYLIGDRNSSNIVIEELYESVLVKKHIYR
jgi:hypothetical protein